MHSYRLYALAAMAWHALVVFPFVFSHGFADRDAARMFNAIFRDISSHPLSHPDTYNRGASFGFYVYLDAVARLIGHDPGLLAAAMNWTAALSSLFTGFFTFQLANRCFNPQTAFVTAILLPVIPAFWLASLYGYPTIPALALFLAGCWVLTVPSNSRVQHATWSGLASALLFLSFSFRMDIVLLIPVLTFLLYITGPKRWLPACARAAGVAGSSLLLFLVAKVWLVSPIAKQEASALHLILTFHRPDLIADAKSFLWAIRHFLGAFNPFLLVLPVVGWRFRSRMDGPRWCLLIAGFAISSIFYLPNPLPIRHYAFGAPFLAMACGVVGHGLVSRTELLTRSRFGLAVIPALALASALSITLIQHAGSRFTGIQSPFHTRFAMDRYNRRNADFAAALRGVPPKNQSFIVFSDAQQVLCQLHLARTPMVVQPHELKTEDGLGMKFVPLRLNGNRLLFLEQSWDRSQVERMERERMYPEAGIVLADPNNQAVQHPHRRKVWKP